MCKTPIDNSFKTIYIHEYIKILAVDKLLNILFIEGLNKIDTWVLL